METVNPNKTQFTWHSNTKPVIFSILDYILISNNLVNFTSSTKIKAGYKSDHSIVNAEFDFIKINKGPGYFKLNNSLILDKDYQTMIKQNIAETAEINIEANPNTLWELIKGTIRNVTIKYASAKKKRENENEIYLKHEIQITEAKLHKLKETEEIEVTQKKTKRYKARTRKNY